MKHYKIILPLLISSVLFFTACDNETVEKNSAAESTVVNSNEIIISSEQFSVNEMKLGEISDMPFSETIRATGMMDVPPEYKADVSVYYGGTVKQLHLLEGQIVKKGETLFVLENPVYIEMQQEFLNAKNNLSYLKQEYERQTKLIAENVSSQKKYSKAESDFFTTRSDYEALKKKLELLNINCSALDFNNIKTSVSIKSPLSGNITGVNITKGEFLSPNKVAIEIINVEHMHLEISVFEQSLSNIKKGQTILFSLPDKASKYYEAEVFLVGKSVNQIERTINIHGHLKDESFEADFIPGMHIEAQILVGDELSPAIEEDAVVNVDDEYFVLVKKSQNQSQYTFEKRKIEIGRTMNGFTQILNYDTFKANDEIIITGAFNLIY